MFRQRTVSFAISVFLIIGSGYAARGHASEVAGDGKTQVVVSSKGDYSKFVGSWHTCTRLASGHFYGNTMQFLRDDNGLVFLAKSGLVGEYLDSVCSNGIASRVRAISAMKLAVKMIETQKLEAPIHAEFLGEADKLISSENAALGYVGFSADFKCIFLSSSISFKGDVLRYEKL